MEELINNGINNHNTYDMLEGVENQGLRFKDNNVTGGVIELVNTQTAEIIDATAGTYEIVTDIKDGQSYRAIKIKPTYTGYNNSWHRAIVEQNGKVYYGNWSEANNGGIFYLFNEDTKNGFVTWFNANKDSITTKIEFGEGKSDWRDEFDGLTPYDAQTFIDATPLYDLEVKYYSDSSDYTNKFFIEQLSGNRLVYQSTEDNGSVWNANLDFTDTHMHLVDNDGADFNTTYSITPEGFITFPTPLVWEGMSNNPNQYIKIYDFNGTHYNTC